MISVEFYYVMSSNNREKVMGDDVGGGWWICDEVDAVFQHLTISTSDFFDGSHYQKMSDVSLVTNHPFS